MTSKSGVEQLGRNKDTVRAGDWDYVPDKTN